MSLRTLLRTLLNLLRRGFRLPVTETRNPFHRPSLRLDPLEARILFSGANPAPESGEAPEVDEEARQAMEQSLDQAALDASQVNAAALGAAELASLPVTLVEPESPASSLNQETLDRIALAATERWVVAGIDPAQLEVLRGATYRIDDLPATQLGRVEHSTVTLDLNAWGQGWYVDESPWDDLEFTLQEGVGWRLDPGHGPTGSIDLLSVLMHEQGHLLGLADTLDPSFAGDLMFQGFAAGERRLPSAGQAEGLIPGAPAASLSAVIAVTTTADGGAGSGSLRAAVISANSSASDDIINLGAGTYQLSLTGINEENAATGDLDIRNNGSLVITGLGKGVTFIDAAGIDRVFDIFDGATVEFRDLTITGGFLDYSHGAGFYARAGSQVTLDQVAISGNTVQTPNVVNNDRHGGGFWSNSATVTGTGVEISGNTAAQFGSGRNAVGGGAWLSGDSTVTLTDVAITGNTSREGGGFYISAGNFGGSVVSLEGAQIAGNTAVVRGGGFYNAAIDGRVSVTDGALTGNVAQFEHGGGFYNAGTVVLAGVDVTGNEAQDLDTTNARRDDSYGGGWFNSTGTVTMTGGSLSGNAAYGHGGGFFNRVGTVTITGSALDPVEIDTNKAGAHDGLGDSRDGGGFYNTETGTVNLSSVVFTGNQVRFSTAGDPATVTGLGAGFRNAGESTVNLNQVTIDSHAAAEGGAFYQDGVKSRVIGTGVSLDQNFAVTRGGAFRNASTGGLVQLTDSSLSGNQVRNEHGGGFYNNGTVLLVNTIIEDNQVFDLDAGGVNLNNNSATPSAGPVQRDSYGGGFYNSGGRVDMQGGTLSGNESFGHGAGFFNSGGIVGLSGTTVDGNRVLRDADLLDSGSHNLQGGGFYNSGDGTVTLHDTRLLNHVLPSDSNGNTRGAGGGFYNVDGSSVLITGASLLSGNRAEDGGAFYNTSTGGLVRITGDDAAPVVIRDNSARVRGGAFRTTGDTEVHLTHVEITANTADIQRGGGFYADGALVVGTHVDLTDNIAGSAGRSGDEQGGGFWLDGYGKVELTDSTVTGNHTEVNGGGFYSQHGTVTLTRTLVEDNTAFNSGGGGFLEADARLVAVDASISRNLARDHGGGFWASGDAAVEATRTHLDGNLAGYELDGVTRRAADLRGGGFNVRDRVKVTLSDSTVDGNVAAQYAGAGYVGGESFVTLLGTTIAENLSGHHGGGFFVESSGRLDLENSTLSGNRAGFRIDDTGGPTPLYVQESVGGAIWTSGAATVANLHHVTVTGNLASRTDGAGIHRSSGTVTLENSIVFGNIGNAEGSPAGTTDTQNSLVLVGANIIGSHGGSALTGDLAHRMVANPNLAPLAANGGFGRTHAIQSSSAAAGSAIGSRLGSDQTGAGRDGAVVATVPVPISQTGAALLTDPRFTLMDPDRVPSLTGQSLNFSAGAADNETLFAYQILPPGKFSPSHPFDVTIDLGYTKLTGDHDFVFTLSDGVNTLTWSMNDNNGGEVFFGPRILLGGEAGVNAVQSIRFAFTINAAQATLTATRGSGQTGGTTRTGTLNPFGGLTFSARLSNAGERTRINSLGVTFAGLTGQEGGADLGAYEADGLATALRLEEVEVPETLIGDQPFRVAASAVTNSGNPLAYLWELRDAGGSLLTSGAGPEALLTASLDPANPVQNVSLTLSVTDTVTGQTVTETRPILMVQPDASVAAGSLGTLVVDTSADVVDGTVTSVAGLLAAKGADGRISLREAVLAANADTGDGSILIQIDPSVSTITLALTPTANENAAANGDLDFTRTRGAVLIQGNGIGVTTLDGGGIDRVFDALTQSAVFLRDLTVTGGLTTTAGGSDHGAGFRNVGGTVVLHQVDLAGNASTRTSDNVGGGFYSTRSGIHAGRVLMTGGFIRNNTAGSHGGGFYVDDPNRAEALVSLKGVVISGNAASQAADRTDRDGGGFYFTGSGNRLEMEEVVIENNTTKDDGGGFYWATRYGEANLDGVVIRGNTTLNPAGGTQDSDGAGFGFTGTGNTFTFTSGRIGEAGAGNVSENDAGGFKVEGKWNTLQFSDTAIEGNSTLNGTGGGFWNTSRFETVILDGDSRIASNTATSSHGGGFRNDGTVLIAGSSANPIEISDNVAGAGTTGNNDRVGGGFFNTSNGTVRLSDVDVSGNTAYSRGGGFLNNGGASVFVTSSDAAAFRSRIQNNSVTSNEDDTANQSWRFWGVGGGFYNESAGSLVDVSDAVITANQAVDHGGAFFTQSNYSRVNLTRVDVTDHQTPDAGGAIFVNSTDAAVHLDTVLIHHNVSTTNHGGAIRNVGAITGSRVTLSENAVGRDLAGNSTSTADLVGGAIYNSSGSIVLADSVIEDNYARGRGGGFYTDGGSTIAISSTDPGLFRSRISGNLVDNNSRDGGGFYVSSAGNLVQLSGVDVSDNHAGRHGGGFYLQSDIARVELSDVRIENNVAGEVPGTTGQGGGFFNASAFSEVWLDRVAIVGNTTRDNNAGGFHNRGRVIGTDVLIEGNLAGSVDRAANNNNNRVGGAFRSTGSESITDLTRVVIAGNSAHGRGGGFYSDASAIVKLTDFILRGNTTDQQNNESQGRGGGFWNSGNADVTLTRGEISDNQSFGHGGGFYQQDTGSSVALTNVVVSGNYAGVDQNGSVTLDTVGGGFWAISGTTRVSLDHVTITGNRVNRNGTDAGAGFRVDTGGNTVTMSNSIVYGNFRQADTASPIADDIDNRTSSNVDFQLIAKNIVGVRTGNAIGGVATSLIPADPLLGPLIPVVGPAMPGGYALRSHFLNAGSPALDAAEGPSPATDQRGAVRPSGAAADLGALEVSTATWSLTGDTHITEGAQPATYVLSLSGALLAGETATVELILTDVGTTAADRDDLAAALLAAIQGRTDFSLSGTTLTHTSTGSAMADLTFQLRGLADALVETDEDFTVSISSTGSTNGASVGGTGTVTTTIAQNTPPSLDPIGNQTIQENGSLTFTATASDPDLPPQPLVFSLDAASAAKGMTIDPLTGAFSWSPDFRHIGTHSVTVTVSDGVAPPLTDSETFQITVNAIPVTATTWIHLDIDGNLVIEDFLGARNTSDAITLEVQGGQLVIRDPRNTLQTTVAGGIQVSPREVRIGTGSFTADVVVDLLGGNDMVTLRSLTGLPGGVRILDGAGFDQVLFAPGTATSLGAGASFHATAETISLRNAALAVAGGGGITLEGIDPAGSGIGRGYVGVTLITSTLSAADTGSIRIDGTGGTSGSGRYGVSLQSGSTITVAQGDLEITGLARSIQSHSNSGVHLLGSTLAKTGGPGSIVVAGTGAGTGAANFGILLTRGSRILADGAASVDLDGTGGGLGRWAGSNDGVKIESQSVVRTVDGPLSVTGTGGATGGKGINLIGGSSLLSAGAGAILLNGTGGAMGSNNAGIALNGSTVSGNGGDVTLEGWGGNGSGFNAGLHLYRATVSRTGTGPGTILLKGSGHGTGSSNHGILLDYRSRVSALGLGAITLEGTATARTGAQSNNAGIVFKSSSSLTAVDGDVSLTGRGALAATGTGNRGIDLQSASLTSSGLGSLRMQGTGGSGTNLNDGIQIYNRSVLTFAGGIDLDGQGGGKGSSNHGISVGSSTLTSSAGISLTGTGGGSSGNRNHGLMFLRSRLTGPATLDGTKGAGNLSRAVVR